MRRKLHINRGLEDYFIRRLPAHFIVGTALLSLLAMGCSEVSLPGLGETQVPSTTASAVVVEDTRPRAELTINLTVPDNTPEGEEIFISFMDEVTGLALNSVSGEMERVDDTHFTTTTVAPIGSVLKYRYSRNGPLSNLEYSANSLPVRYRLYRVQDPGVVEDVISRWQDTPFLWPTGRIKGEITDFESNSPIPNVLVTAGGVQTISAADGSFLLEGLPDGKHNLVAYAMDGAYETFQQEAIVAEGSTTPAPLAIAKNPSVDVTFNVTMPDGTPPGVPINFAGNLSHLGNSFADLEGGMSSLPHRMPVLTALPDGGFTLTLELPVGTDLRYKYTLGDGFWNAELNPNGTFPLRQLIVPDESTTIEDTVEAWRAGDNAPIWFDVNVPGDTPADDTISVQYNPYGWTQPVPMWRLDTNRWGYLLSSPLNLLDTIGYRYCRNDQCGTADDVLTPGDQTGGRPLTMNTEAQTIQDTVGAWEKFSAVDQSVTVPNSEIPDRGETFVTGIELSTNYHPSWEPRLPRALETIAGTQAGWAVLTPTWSFTQISPPVLEQVPGEDMLWDQLLSGAAGVRDANLNLAIRPVPVYPFNPGDWWAAATRDTRWWDAWFERYQTFILHHAQVAQESGAGMLIIGGPEVALALAGSTLGDGTPSGVPPDADLRWRDLIEEIRTIYGGELGWALPLVDDELASPLFLDTLDFVYVLWSPPLAESGLPNGSELTEEANRILDTVLLPAIEEFPVAVIIGPAYPSAAGVGTGCLTDPVEGDCLTEAEMSVPNPPYHNLEVDLDAQVEIYNSILTAVSARDWVSGFVSRGFFPAVTLQDTSISVHGKPALELLSYWFPRLTGAAP